jgi:lipoate-protein ligase A
MNALWQFIDTGVNTGTYNMQFDQMLARHLLEGTGCSTLRIYRWMPWAISLGFNQDPGEIDIAKCAEQGIDLVRRPTGGRAILHAEELTYSVVMFPGRRGVLEAYRDISNALVRGLNLFGVEVTLQRSQPNFAENYRNPSSAPCFMSSARYEIESRGRKLVGSAQRRYGVGEQMVLLQHGSILTGSAHRSLVRYLTPREGARVDDITAEMHRRTIDLREVRGSEVDLQELGACIKRGFELAWGISLVPPGDYRHQLRSEHELSNI